MGTNFYLFIKDCRQPKCVASKRYHIGKSSDGWRFLFNFIPKFAEDFERWKKLLSKGEIHDEYGRHIEAEMLLGLVQSKQKQKLHTKIEMGENIKVIGGYDFFEADFS